MEIELRALSLGEVLDRTLQIYRAHFRMFIGIVAFGAFGMLFWQASQFTLVHLLWKTHPHRTILIVNSALTIGYWILGLFLLPLVLGATYRAVADICTGKRAGVASSYAALRSVWVRYIALGFISLSLFVSPITIIFGNATIRPLLQSLGGAGALAAYSAFSWTVLPVALAFGLWFGSLYTLAGGAFVFENIGIVQACRRSAILARGQRVRILAVLVLMITIKAATSGAYGALLLPYMKTHYGRTSVEAAIATLFFNTIARILADPILGIGWMVCYFDARIRREGFDVEMLLQRSAVPHVAAAVLLPDESGLGRA